MVGEVVLQYSITVCVGTLELPSLLLPNRNPHYNSPPPRSSYPLGNTLFSHRTTRRLHR